jgi:hypothetical protein
LHKTNHNKNKINAIQCFSSIQKMTFPISKNYAHQGMKMCRHVHGGLSRKTTALALIENGFRCVIKSGVPWETKIQDYLIFIAEHFGAGDGTRTRDVKLGKLAFYH